MKAGSPIHNVKVTPETFKAVYANDPAGYGLYDTKVKRVFTGGFRSTVKLLAENAASLIGKDF